MEGQTKATDSLRGQEQSPGQTGSKGHVLCQSPGSLPREGRGRGGASECERRWRARAQAATKGLNHEGAARQEREERKGPRGPRPLPEAVIREEMEEKTNTELDLEGRLSPSFKLVRLEGEAAAYEV